MNTIICCHKKYSWKLMQTQMQTLNVNKALEFHMNKNWRILQYSKVKASLLVYFYNQTWRQKSCSCGLPIFSGFILFPQVFHYKSQNTRIFPEVTHFLMFSRSSGTLRDSLIPEIQKSWYGVHRGYGSIINNKEDKQKLTFVVSLG